MVDQLSGQHETAPAWPDSIDVPGIGRVKLIQPGQRYPVGSTLAVIWPYTSPPVAPSVLRERAERLGKAWQPSTSIPAIGAQLSKARYGFEVVGILTGGAWKTTDAMIVPFEVPAGLITDGITAGDFAAATEGLGDVASGLGAAMAGAVESGGKGLTVAAWLLAAAPWILLTAGLVLSGLYVWKKVK